MQRSDYYDHDHRRTVNHGHMHNERLVWTLSGRLSSDHHDGRGGIRILENSTHSNCDSNASIDMIHK
jgi:hypothetical protein